jgi:hypothetical protein
MFRSRDGAPRATRSEYGHLDRWRAAATYVWMCWDALLASPPEGRPRAYAAYGDALDAEAAAAQDVAARMTAGA